MEDVFLAVDGENTVFKGALPAEGVSITRRVLERG